MINKAMIEIPPHFANLPPVNPDARNGNALNTTGWVGANGLAEDVRYYGEWMKKEAFKLLEMGGYIDFTCSDRKQGAAGKSIREAMELGLPTERITLSSDGQGSWSQYDKEGNLLKFFHPLIFL